MENKIDNLRKRIKTAILDIIYLCRDLPKDDTSRVFINQIIRASTSVGANFEESVEAESNKDIIHKLSIVRKETKETLYWLDLIKDVYSSSAIKIDKSIQEFGELIKIFSSIISKRKNIS